MRIASRETVSVTVVWPPFMKSSVKVEGQRIEE